MWEYYQKLPKEIKNVLPQMFGKWHYHYENKNGEIGLIKLIDTFPSILRDKRSKGYCYEACGVLDFKQFYSLADAEKAICEALGEELVNDI